MTTLLIAEKPSQAMDIGKVIGIKSRGDGFVELVNGWKISWAVGHLLEQAQPSDYNEAWGGRWSWDQLPMIPDTWHYNIKKATSKQFTVIKTLLKTATLVIIATDAGREGELIARSILAHTKYKGKVKRFWTSSLVASDIKKALDNLLDGSKTEPLYEAALARAHGDFLLGLSGTRAASLAANVRGDFFAMGRVQTPTLAMVVRRHLSIKGFVAEEFYDLEATVNTKKGESFKMAHTPAPEQRIKTKAQAEALAKKASGYSGPISASKAPEKESPPLPFSLPELQKEANRVYGFSAASILKIAQALYEKKAITYPRTDCPYLAESQILEVPETLEVIAKRFKSAVDLTKKFGITTRNSTFNDSKLADHHAIVPSVLYVQELEGQELQLYTLICQRYLQTVSADHQFMATRLKLNANDVEFKATGRQVTSEGWKSIKLVGSKDEE